MDLFAKFNREGIEDRQIDTLIGLSKGIISDGIVNQSEAEFLLTWLIQNYQASKNPLLLNLLNKVEEMLADNFLDEQESMELLNILKSLSGEESSRGELAKPSSLPFCSPKPEVKFKDKNFLFTGTFVYGIRKNCQKLVLELEGQVSKSVTKNLDYLVIGSYVTDSWIHETFGRKIEKAVKYREEGVPLKIISEDLWIKSAGI